MLLARVLEQIARWRPYSVVSSRSQMAPPLVEEALLGVPLADQWSCRVSRRGHVLLWGRTTPEKEYYVLLGPRTTPESDDEKEYYGLSKPTQASLALNLRWTGG